MLLENLANVDRLIKLHFFFPVFFSDKSQEQAAMQMTKGMPTEPCICIAL